MIYVKTMALRAWNECHSTNRCEGTIEQVIADTKRACCDAAEDALDHNKTMCDWCVDAIASAEVKAEGE